MDIIENIQTEVMNMDISERLQEQVAEMLGLLRQAIKRSQKSSCCVKWRYAEF